MPKAPFDAYTGKVTTSSGKDVKSTDMLKGEAKESKAFNEKNVTTVYTTGATVKGPFGGTPSREG